MTQTSNQHYYLSHTHTCSYLEGRLAMNLFVDPYSTVDTQLYSDLITQGFRRSGKFFYRPQCPGCSECVPVRIPVHQFIANRSQKRCWNRNRSVLKVNHRDARYRKEHYRLYRKYISTRHQGGGMDKPDVESYMAYLCETTVDTSFLEFHLQEELVAVSVIDWLDNGISSVYTYFDPELKNRSLGVFSILWQIEEAKRCNLNYLYLGYWIQDCKKMNYKSQFQTLELFRNERWRTWDPYYIHPNIR